MSDEVQQKIVLDMKNGLIKNPIKDSKKDEEMVAAYDDFLQKCIAKPIVADALYNIFWEELDVYFTNDRSAEETASFSYLHST